jgi:hypothetical protein
MTVDQAAGAPRSHDCADMCVSAAAELVQCGGADSAGWCRCKIVSTVAD